MNDDARGLVCCVVPLMSITPREITLPPASFFVITDLNFVVNKCDTKLRHYIELEHEDMLDVSIYSMIHPNDIDNLQRAHQQLLNKGQRWETTTKPTHALTSLYSATLHFRWFQRNSGHKWVKSTLSKTQIKGNTEDCILWVNQVIRFFFQQPVLALFILHLLQRTSRLVPRTWSFSTLPCRSQSRSKWTTNV